MQRIRCKHKVLDVDPNQATKGIFYLCNVCDNEVTPRDRNGTKHWAKSKKQVIELEIVERMVKMFGLNNKGIGTVLENFIHANMKESLSNTPLKYRPLPSNTYGLDAVIVSEENKIGVQIKSSVDIETPLYVNTEKFQNTVDACKNEGINTILIITNKKKISETVRNFFETRGLKYLQLTRDNFM